MDKTVSQTQAKFRERWIVKVGREEFELTGEQMSILRGKMAQEQRGFIAFDDFGFGIQHVAAWWLSERKIDESHQLSSEEKNKPLSEEERVDGRKKIEEIRKEHFGDRV